MKVEGWAAMGIKRTYERELHQPRDFENDSAKKK